MVQLTELGNRSLLKVLLFFLRNPTTQVSYTSLRKRVGIAKATLSLHLSFLEKESLIAGEKLGLNKLYQANRENIIFKQLKILDNLLLLSSIKELHQKYPIEIYLYGSSARGEDTEGSDMDVIILGNITKEHIFHEINKIAKKIGREIKCNTYKPWEWSQMARKDPPFYERVEKDKIKLT